MQKYEIPVCVCPWGCAVHRLVCHAQWGKGEWGKGLHLHVWGVGISCTPVEVTEKMKLTKRMHSSKMRAGHSLTVYWRLLVGQGICLVWGCLPVWGVSAWSRGVCLVPGGYAWCQRMGGSAWCWGVCLVLGGSAWSQGGLGLPGPGGVCLVLGGSGIPACTEADSPLLTESQTPVKTLPWPNFNAAGNKS